MRNRVFKDSSSTTSAEGAYTEGGEWWHITATSENCDYDSFHDVVTQDFEKLKNKGNLFFNPMARYTLAMKAKTVGLYGVTAANSDGPCGGNFAINQVPFDIANPPNMSLESIQELFEDVGNSTLRDQAIAKAWSRVDQTELLLGASLGEMPETVEFICSLFKRFIYVLRVLLTKQGKIKAARSLRRMTAKKALDAMSDAWLEFRYAFRPLVSELDGAVRVLQSNLKGNERFTARASSKNDRLVANDWIVQVFGTLKCSQNVTTSESYTADAGCLYTLGDIPGLSLALGLDSPIETVWELVPFSFILDWFVNVGTILSSFEQNASIKVRGTWVTERLTRMHRSWCDTPTEEFSTRGYHNVSVQIQDDGLMTALETVQLRTISPARPILPSVKINLNLAKLLDLVTIGKGLLNVTSRR